MITGHFYFTQLLLPALIKGAASSLDGRSRVVNTTSFALYFGSLDFVTFRDGPARVKKGTADLYNQSKFVRWSDHFSIISQLRLR